MLTQHCLHCLNKIGLQIQSVKDLTSGVKLADAINTIFYQGNNQTFSNKIIRQKQDRKGHNVINMNMILKQIQKDQNIQCPPSIQSLTSFSMTEDIDKLINFVQWIIEQYQQKDKNIISKQNNQQDAFQNVYFGVQFSPDRNQQRQDPIWQTDKVVKKGSFKIIRPKQLNTHQTIKNSPDGLKQRKIIQNLQNQQNKQEQDRDLSPRKTVLKMIQKPPMYRHSKQKTKLQKQKSQSNVNSKFINSPAPFSCQKRNQSNQKSQRQSSIKYFQNIKRKNIDLQKDIMDISCQIDKYQESQKRKLFNETKRNNSSSKKIFKADINDVMEWQKKQIVQWLVNTNLLSIQITKNYYQLHQICKNGVLFPQIINRNKGRGNDVSYFKNPKRPAQINANYQKVFNYLKQLPNFTSQLTFLYQYFVPQAQERAFWSLLKSIYKCFTKKCLTNGNQTKSIYSRESEIKQKMKRSKSMNSSKKLSNSQKKQPQYQKIKYGNNSSIKEKKKSQKIITKPSIQFIKEMPDKLFKHQQLIQKEQPVDFGLVSHGYRQLHEMKKNYIANTPKKRSNDTSLTRSRIISMNSVKKSGQKLNIPSVNLQMEMKALKFLKQKKYINFFQREDKELFKDPVRNGILINQIIFKELQRNQVYNKKPKNIQDCRQNYRIALRVLKKQVPQLPLAYQHHKQQIIKGQINLFYGLIWYLIWNKNTEKDKVNFNLEKPKLFQPDNTQQNILMWIRALEQNNTQICKLRIRDSRSLQNSIISSNLLYKIASVLISQKYILKPTYDQPINSVQQQANLRKILSFFMQNKVLKHQYVWKIKNIVKKDTYIINNLMNDLMSYYMSKNNQNQDSQRVTFMKYMRKNSNQNRNYQRLETTMANQSFGNNVIQNRQENNVSVQPLQVGWMRKLGFEGDLSLNNGVILCQLICRFTMQTILGIKQNPQTKAQCRTNIRKAIKQISKFKWDQDDIFQADRQTTLEIYKFLKEKYKHSYAMKLAF